MEDLHPASGGNVRERLAPDHVVRVAVSCLPRVHWTVQLDGEVAGDGVRCAGIGALGKGRTSELSRTGNKLFVLGGNKCVPCPEQCSYEEHPVQCVDCLLCTKDQMLRERGLTIAFHAHRRKSEQLQASLQAKGQ